MRVVIVICTAMAFAPSPAECQTAIQGVVTDTLGRPIGGAMIQVADGVGTLTDQSGAYALEVQPGDYSVRASAVGYVESALPVTVNADGHARVRHIQLTPAVPPEAIWLGCAVREDWGEAFCLDPARVGADPLWVEDPGRWVIRSEEEWERFWDDHDSSGSSMSPPGSPPEVDWNLNVLVLVGGGQTSGCQNRRRYINRVVLYRNRTVVYVGPDAGAGGLSCAALIAPVDAVLVPRGYGEIEFEVVEKSNC